MKKRLLILFTILTAFGCTKEITDGCPVGISVIFTHRGVPADFHTKIGNDVLLHVYEDGLLKQAPKLIGYEELQSGEPYYIGKKTTAKMDIVAWAVPRGGDSRLMSQSSDHTGYADAYFELPVVSRNNTVCDYGKSELFLGKVNLDGSASGELSVHNVPMTNTMCHVTVKIIDPENYSAQYKEQPVAEVEGSSSRFTVHTVAPSGNPALVRSAMTVQDGMLATNRMGILPSSLDENNNAGRLKINLYNGDDKIYYLDTGEVSEPDKNIIVLLNMKEGYANITVDMLDVGAWKVKVQLVQIK